MIGRACPGDPLFRDLRPMRLIRPCICHRLPLLRLKSPPRKGRAVQLSGSESSGFREHLLDMLPIDEIVDEGFEIFRARIAVVDVVAVLPHIDAEDRL